MRLLTFCAVAPVALVFGQPKIVEREDWVVATIDGKVVSWINNYHGPGAPTPNANPGGGGNQPASTPPASTSTSSPVQVSTPPAITPTTTTPSSAVVTTTAASPPANPTGGNSGPSGSSCPQGQQSIELENNSGKDLHIQAGAPWEVGNCGTVAAGSTCTFCQIRGSTGGNLQVGYGTPNSRSTWIEGNWDQDAQFPCMDISYIPGYSVPILCTGSDGNSTIGMSEPLCTDEACTNCEAGGGTYQDGACLNPMGDPKTVLVDGPAPSFFETATGIVYTYPNDSHDGYAPVWDSAKCVAHPQFGSTSSKRELGSTAYAHGHKKHRRQHLHKHGVHGGSKL